MKFKMLPEGAEGASLVGYVTTPRRNIERVFGPATFLNAGDKVTTEWCIQFEDGTEVTIYDWKRYSEEPIPMDERFNWNVGGDDTKIHYVCRLLGDALGMGVSAAR